MSDFNIMPVGRINELATIKGKEGVSDQANGFQGLLEATLNDVEPGFNVVPPMGIDSPAGGLESYPGLGGNFGPPQALPGGEPIIKS